MLNLVRKQIRCPRSPHLRSRLESAGCMIIFQPQQYPIFSVSQTEYSGYLLQSEDFALSPFNRWAINVRAPKRSFETKVRVVHQDVRVFIKMFIQGFHSAAQIISTEKIITLSKVCPFLNEFKAKIEIVKDVVIKVSIGPPSIPWVALNSLPSRREASYLICQEPCIEIL